MSYGASVVSYGGCSRATSKPQVAYATLTLAFDSEGPPRLAPGDVVRGSYRVEAFLGAGAYGEVYRVEHRFLGMQALKVVRPHNSTAPSEVLAEAAMLVRF